MTVSARGSGVIKAMAGDVFNTFHIVAPDGDAFIPPCFVMAAAHEMGYYPTAHYLQQVVSVTTGWCGRVTYPLFLQMCAMLEGTRALDDATIKCYRDAFDVRGNGELSRTEFRIILATSAASELTSCEAEAIIDFLDPHGTNIVKLRDLEELLMKCLAVDGEPVDPVVSSKRSSGRSRFMESSRISGQDFPPHSRSSGATDKGRKTVVAESKMSGDSSRARGAPPHATAPRSPSTSAVSEARQPLAEGRKREPSPLPGVLEGLVSSQERTSRGIAPPKTTAPSPCLSGAVTRATSVAHFESPPSQVVSTNPGYSPPPMEDAMESPYAPNAYQQGSAEMPVGALHLDPHSTTAAFSAFPVARESTRGPEGTQEWPPGSSGFTGRTNETHTGWRVLSIPSLEEMRDVTTENSRVVSQRSNARHSGENMPSQDGAACRGSGRSVGTYTGSDMVCASLPNQRRPKSSPCCAMF
ncbi:hypothetical protein, conserved [Trypanosoma brucei gambiense DAL972]|uniref:Calmodulin n=2 Tax=Trypanosoma brucei gambiense (strain MHOM/CI/86/DAL972) TaxID=679716 RepID=C9ZZH4_TRYB9|nr:hypothetical protein, conserved [Trypanosoma brucei gambiense DAL972]CBH14823.1 hypothetical protein, conserved [Trypanosoma brucei gambiense DAL972]|eukprot:XP_011777089.1 hypothetical protein, conserved [Trypanosoma brucei gambiense DAL972]